jgi:hypothetical protein
MQSSSSSVRASLLSTLKYFPLAGFIIKLIMDVATSDSINAISSIIQDSCIVLYLVCILGFLISPTVPKLPKLASFVICLLLGLYLSSIILNAKYIPIIDTNNVDDIKPASATFWILTEIVILMKFMASYVSSITSSLVDVSDTWLLVLLLPMIPHFWIVYTNFEKMSNGSTDDATRNIQPMD